MRAVTEQAERDEWLHVDAHLITPTGKLLFVEGLNLSSDEAWELIPSPYHDSALVPKWKITQLARWRMEVGRPPRDDIKRQRVSRTVVSHNSSDVKT